MSIRRRGIIKAEMPVYQLVLIKSLYMKKIAIVLGMLACGPCFSQTPFPVEYRGGQHALDKLLSRTTTGDMLDSGHPEVRTNRYYAVEFSLDSAGKMGDNLSIVSTAVWDIEPLIFEWMKKSQGNWINHTGHTVQVIIPMAFLYDDLSKPLDKQPMDWKAVNFSNWQKQ